MVSVRYMALRDGDGCQQCGSKENLTRDHIWPKSRGGCGCDGNFQILCKDCNEAKSNDHDGKSGHTRADCPEAELRRFMTRWRDGHRDMARDEVRGLVPEMVAIAKKLSEYGCRPISIQKAHSMVGSLNAYVRDFDIIRAQQADEKPVTLERLRKTEARLVERLGYVREQIAELEDELPPVGDQDGDLDAGPREGHGVAPGA